MRFAVVAFMVSVAGSMLSERLGAAGAETLTGQELVESSALARASTARISAETCDGFARGSAFAVDGATITSHHLVDGAETARLDDGRASVERPVLAGAEALDAARLAETPQALEAFLRVFVDAGVDVLHASQRRWWDAEFPEVDGDEGLNLAGWCKKLTGLPSITVGSVGLSSDFIGAFRGEGSGHPVG